MRCRPSRWLWGLLPLALLIYLVQFGDRPRIEKDLTDRTNQALLQAGQGWSSITFQGRDGALTGTTEEQVNQDQALAIARNVWGVRIADDRTSLIELIRPYAWSITREGGRIRLIGYVPSGEERQELVAAAKAAFPVSKIEDQLRLGRGIERRANWLAGAKYGIEQLARLERGEARLDDMRLSVSGMAQNAASYTAVVTALRQLPPRINRGTIAITPPVIDPFVFAARADANRTVTLTGYLPSETAQRTIVAAVKRQFGGYRIDDRTVVAGGAPTGLIETATSALPQLAALDAGELAFSGRSASLTGIVDGEDAATTISKDFMRTVVAPFTGRPSITFRTPRQRAISPYVWSACFSNDVLTLDGYVPDEATRQTVLGYANQRFLGRTIADRMQIGAGAPQPTSAWLASVQTGLRGIALVGGGCARQTDKRLAIQGETTVKGLPDRVSQLLRQALPQGYSGDAQIALTTLAVPEPPKVSQPEPSKVVVVAPPAQPAVPVAAPFYTTVKYDGINVTFDGVVPSEAARRQLLSLAQRSFPDRTFVDRLAVANGAPDRWFDVMAIGLGQLAGLDAGQFTLNDRKAFLSGATDSEQSKAAANRILTTGLPAGFSGGEQLTYVAPPKPDPKILVIKQQQQKYDVSDLLASSKQLDSGECQAVLETVARRGKALFARGSAAIDGAGRDVLMQLVPITARCPAARIRIAGHTDSDGATAFNQRLSERRAAAVVEFLSSAGVERGRLAAIGYGESQPIAENTTAENKAQNRRIEFEVHLQ